MSPQLSTVMIYEHCDKDEVSIKHLPETHKEIFPNQCTHKEKFSNFECSLMYAIGSQKQ